MFPAENDMHLLVELRVRKRVIEWLEAENDDYLKRGEYCNSRVDDWNAQMSSLDWLLPSPIGRLEKFDLSWRYAHGETLDWLYAETLWELLHLEEDIRVAFEFSPQRVVLPTYNVLPYPCPEFGEV